MRERSTVRLLIYLLVSVLLPLLGLLLNHMYWKGNLLLSIFLIAWMGFSLMALQPYSTEGYETIEP